jgi:hypothetical protein
MCSSRLYISGISALERRRNDLVCEMWRHSLNRVGDYLHNIYHYRDIVSQVRLGISIRSRLRSIDSRLIVIQIALN